LFAGVGSIARPAPIRQKPPLRTSLSFLHKIKSLYSLPPLLTRRRCLAGDGDCDGRPPLLVGVRDREGRRRPRPRLSSPPLSLLPPLRPRPLLLLLLLLLVV
jgi:hypothetical protein